MDWGGLKYGRTHQNPGSTVRGPLQNGTFLGGHIKKCSKPIQKWRNGDREEGEKTTKG